MVSKQLKEFRSRVEKVDKGFKKVNKQLSPTSRRVFKKEKPATVVYRGSNPSYHFKKEFQQEKALLGWN